MDVLDIKPDDPVRKIFGFCLTDPFIKDLRIIDPPYFVRNDVSKKEVMYSLKTDVKPIFKMLLEFFTVLDKIKQKNVDITQLETKSGEMNAVDNQLKATEVDPNVQHEVIIADSNATLNINSNTEIINIMQEQQTYTTERQTHMPEQPVPHIQYNTEQSISIPDHVDNITQ